MSHEPGQSCRSPGAPPDAFLAVEATHAQGLVARLAVLLNAHDVTAFTYRTNIPHNPDAVDLTARIEVVMTGDPQQAARAAHRLRRVIGVHHVTVGLPAQSTPPPAQAE